MKKPEIKIDFSELRRQSQNANWQRALLWAILVSLLLFSVATLYLFFRPLSDDIKASIDTEIQSQQINFDFTTLEMLKGRQVPPTTNPSPSGKNPFTPF
jgi:hypothetical protein